MIPIPASFGTPPPLMTSFFLFYIKLFSIKDIVSIIAVLVIVLENIIDRVFFVSADKIRLTVFVFCFEQVSNFFHVF